MLGFGEIESERCDELRAELVAIMERSCFDELRVLAVLARRIEVGRNRYGYLDLHADKRDFRRERAEEYVDAAIYDACDLLAEHDRSAKERR